MVVIAVASAESGLRGGATNHNMDGSTDYGCYQVDAIHRNRVAGTLNAGTTLRRTQSGLRDLLRAGWCPCVAARKIGFCD
jgi:hypothetical protein